jgi:hypothetical protein
LKGPYAVAPPPAGIIHERARRMHFRTRIE